MGCSGSAGDFSFVDFHDEPFENFSNEKPWVPLVPTLVGRTRDLRPMDMGRTINPPDLGPFAVLISNARRIMTRCDNLPP
jgi:hypothetical protein